MPSLGHDLWRPPSGCCSAVGLASRALALDAALTAADGTALPLRPTETALLRDWLRQLAC
jgi:hypothetical protein